MTDRLLAADDPAQLALFLDPLLRHRHLWACVDCGRWVHDEHYMVRDDVWPIDCDGGQLCIGCLEARIGRRLRPDDFPAGVPINDPRRSFKSDRLRDRLAGEESAG